MATTLTLTSYRFRNDDGDEAGASWIAPENTAPTLYANKKYRVRTLITESGGTAWTTGSAVLRQSVDATTYSVGGLGTLLEAAGSSWYADGANSTEQITSAGTFTAANTGMVSDTLTGTVTVSANEEAEVEWCFIIRHIPGVTRDGMTVYLQPYNSTSALDVYTNTPSFVLRIPGGGRGR